VSALAGLHIHGCGPGRFLLQIPLIGPTLRLGESARFAHYLAMLVENHIPMAEALGLLSESAENSYVQAALNDFHQRYEAGERLGDLISNQPLFPAGMAVLISSAEDQGGLALTLKKLGKYYQERTIHANTVLREVFEPIMLILMGAFLSLILLGVYGPLFDMPSYIY
jgi:type II secretory pathway component PulF